MRQRFTTAATWIGYAIVLGGAVLVVRDYPITLALLVGGAALAILLLTAWYDYDHWRRKYLRWRHADLLRAAAAVVDPYVDELAVQMDQLLIWDGRSDYKWQPWIERSREFVDATVVPALSLEQQRIVAECGPILQEEIRSEASSRVIERAQHMGLLAQRL